MEWEGCIEYLTSPSCISDARNTSGFFSVQAHMDNTEQKHGPHRTTVLVHVQHGMCHCVPIRISVAADLSISSNVSQQSAAINHLEGEGEGGLEHHAASAAEAGIALAMYLRLQE